MTNYLICTLARSGSTLLCRGLRSTGIAGRPEEYFAPALRGQFSRHWNLPADTSDEDYLARVRQEATTPNGVFGAKAPWSHLLHLEAMLTGVRPPRKPAPLASPEVIERFLPGVRYVHLTRRDKTAQAISFYKARSTGQWSRPVGVAKPAEQPELTLDAAAIERLERGLRENDWRWVDYFTRARVKPLTIAYEDFVADYEGTIRAVLRFLELPDADTVRIGRPALRRQSDQRSRRWRRRVVESRAARVASNHRRLPAVSVIIVSHNEGENLRRTVDAFAATVPDSVELVVVDDCSTDGSVEALGDDGRVRVVAPAQRAGIAPARNLGAEQASGDILVFSDAHVNPAQGWLPPLCRALADPRVGAVAPAVSRIERRSEKGYGITWRDASLNVRWFKKPVPGPVPFLCGCFMAFRRDDFEAVGGFDAGLDTWGCEDAEICMNLWRRGVRCQVVPESDIGHLFRPAFPYAVQLRATLHNVLRVATVHFSEQALRPVLAQAARSPAFAGAYADLMDSDAWQRRDLVSAAARHDGDWFLDRFRISLQS
jgi:LPS sulfotransferase NodH/glycosyltransferase involved in cell wall biosynthesis